MDEKQQSVVSELWSAVKLEVEGLEKDVAKNDSKHNVAAGVRVRKGLKRLAKLAKEMSKATRAADAATKAARKQAS